MRWVVLFFVAAFAVGGKGGPPSPNTQGARLPTRKELTTGASSLLQTQTKYFTQEELEGLPYILENVTEAMVWANTTGNLNATLKPILVCANDCFGHGECIEIPSASPSPSAIAQGMADPNDPNVQLLKTVNASDPGALARMLAEQAAKDAAAEEAASASASPAASPIPVPKGASPSASPLPGQIGGPIADDMISGTPAGFPGGPALPWERRLVPGMCVCDIFHFGPMCEFEYCYPMQQCMGRGVCRNTSIPYNPNDDPPMYCDCEDGWRGPNCEHQEHRCGILVGEKSGYGGNCNGNGVCHDGVCVCDEGWSGLFCEKRECILGCSGHGKCDHSTGTCHCDLPFFGKSCSLMFCPNNCSGHGVCDRYEGECDCDANWFGDRCTQKMCPHDCSGHGDCNLDNGECTCYSRYAGLACDEWECPDNCHGGHQCINGTCICDPGWQGLTCNISVCWHQCKNFSHAICDKITGWCHCEKGWVGPRCDIDDRCPKWTDDWDERVYDCTNHGKCVDGKCACERGWAGEDCSGQLFVCGVDYLCANGGTCTNGKCFCPPLWRGFDCSLEASKMCHKDEDCLHGQCIEGGICECHDHWGGLWCHKYTGRVPFEPDEQPPSSTPSPSPSVSPAPSASPKAGAHKHFNTTRVANHTMGGNTTANGTAQNITTMRHHKHKFAMVQVQQSAAVSVAHSSIFCVAIFCTLSLFVLFFAV